MTLVIIISGAVPSILHFVDNLHDLSGGYLISSYFLDASMELREIESIFHSYTGSERAHLEDLISEPWAYLLS